MTASLPADARYRQVVWTVVGLAADATDADRLPDTKLLNGTGVIVATPPVLKYLGTSPETILPQPVPVKLVNSKLLDSQSGQGVFLLCNDSPLITPNGSWTYELAYQLDDGVTFGTITFQLPYGDGSAYDLTPVVPQAASNGDLVLQGPQGEKGDPGDPGAPGTAGQILSATAIGLAPGAAPTVTLGGTNTLRTFQFGIPAGAKGDQGDQGIQGNPGADSTVPGPAGTITSVTAVGLAAGVSPTITLGGTASARTIQLGIPQGAKGDTGAASTVAGPAGTITSVTVSPLATGATPTVTLGGTASARTIALGIPTGPQGVKGDQGDPGAGAPDATTTTKGSIQLAGDLAGTAAAPSVPGLAGKVSTSDSRLTDARTPMAHASTHASGGSDPVTPAAIGAAAASHTHTASQVSDTTTIGRSLMTAADASTARGLIGAGTSSLTLGTTSTTALAGNYAPPADGAAGTATMRTLGTGSTQAAAGNHTHTASAISDSTTVGRSVLMAADAATARSAIGAGTSSLAIGTTSSTAKAGDYQPTSANISDSTATGRSVLTAASAAAARTTIGAGVVDSSDASVLNVVKITQSAYDALATKVATTAYLIAG